MTGAGVAEIREHYDRLSRLYRLLWGEHIHHGYWEAGEELPPAEAQVRLIEQLAERARIPHKAAVLDVGCGIGGSSRWLARNRECRVLGITLSPVQARMAAQRARDEKLDCQVAVAVLDANRLTVKPEAFDVVWTIECSEHLADKKRFFEECAAALRPGGRLALCAWLDGGNNDADSARLLADICRGMLCPSLAKAGDYKTWMEEAGFSSIEFEDVTMHVARTWDICAALVARPSLKALLPLVNARIRRFVQVFPAMQRAYANGAMKYGMFTARR